MKSTAADAEPEDFRTIKRKQWLIGLTFQKKKQLGINVGYSYNSITIFLNLYHGISTSIWTLKKRLRHYSLRRKQIAFNENIVRVIIEREIQGPGSMKGCRFIHQILKQSYGVHVPRDSLMQILKEIDSSRTEERKWKKLKRRKYFSLGPNATWYFGWFWQTQALLFSYLWLRWWFFKKDIVITRSNNNLVVPNSYYIWKQYLL